jgi:hypothetical protein
MTSRHDAFWRATVNSPRSVALIGFFFGYIDTMLYRPSQKLCRGPVLQWGPLAPGFFKSKRKE